MAGYRLYFFDTERHIRHVSVIEADDDAQACVEAESQRDDRATELWLRDRLVREWPAGSAPSVSRRPTGKR